MHELLDRYEGLVVKDYRAPRDLAPLRELVAFPQCLEEADRQLLAGWTAWPLAVVERDEAAVGVVMRRAPAEFAGTTAAGPQLREVQYLLYPPTRMWGDIRPLDTSGRLAVVRQAAALFALLHAHGLAVGDVSLINLLWSPAPTGILLLDCDDIRPGGGASTHTRDWVDPLRHAPDSDHYKLALLVGRVLAGVPRVRPGEALRLPPELPARLAADVRTGFGLAAGPAGSRPSARQWVEILG